MTRVAAGAIPDFRAARRASVPLSRTFFRFRFIENLFRGQFANGAPSLMDCFIGVSERPRVRIGDVDAAKRTAADFAWRLSRRPLRIIERIVFVRVAVGPAIDGDRLDVAGRFESTGREHAIELIAYVAFEHFKGCRIQLRAAGTLLLARRQPRGAWNVLKVNYARSI